MMRSLAALVITFATCFASVLAAQEPRITVTADQEEVVVGQPYLLRVEVLVPTFMPTPPVFPTFETPGLIVRLPERSTSPISERIDGDTWSGVRRTYRIYPTRAGDTEIAAQQVSIVYKDTDTNEDVSLSVDVPATTITATVPPGARALDPLVIAQEITVEQTWQAGDGTLAVGDAVVRALDISVEGASALFVPPLLETALPRPDSAQTGQDAEVAAPFQPYPEDSTVTENIERGVMSGTRHEQVSYIAQSGGAVEFPDITLRWYNIASDEIEEIVLEGRSFDVAMPPVVRTPPDLATLLRWAAFAVLVAGLGWAARKFLWPPVRASLRAGQTRYAATAHAAHREAVRCAKAQDLTGLLIALDERTRRGCPPGAGLEAAITALTRTIYGAGARVEGSASDWRAIQQALQAEKPPLFARSAGDDTEALPRLNPFTTSNRQTVYFNERS